MVRMNLRGAGAGFGLARGIYHAGRTEDVREVVQWLARRAPSSPIALAGFSLGANLALKLAAEAADRPVPGLDCVLAANPPIDLAACARTMLRPENRFYDWNFLRWLRAEVTRLHRHFPDLGPPDLGRVRSVYDFDDRYTAPRNGFASADDYYARSSALPLIPRITLPGLVIHAADDPFIPSEPFRSCPVPGDPPVRADPARRAPGIRQPVTAAGRSALARCPPDRLARRPVGNLEPSSRQRPVLPRSGGCQPGSL